MSTRKLASWIVVAVVLLVQLPSHSQVPLRGQPQPVRFNPFAQYGPPSAYAAKQFAQVLDALQRPAGVIKCFGSTRIPTRGPDGRPFYVWQKAALYNPAFSSPQKASGYDVPAALRTLRGRSPIRAL